MDSALSSSLAAHLIGQSMFLLHIRKDKRSHRPAFSDEQKLANLAEFPKMHLLCVRLAGWRGGGRQGGSEGGRDGEEGKNRTTIKKG